MKAVLDLVEVDDEVQVLPAESISVSQSLLVQLRNENVAAESLPDLTGAPTDAMNGIKYLVTGTGLLVTDTT